jgi:hypothetical protein
MSYGYLKVLIVFLVLDISAYPYLFDMVSPPNRLPGFELEDNNFLYRCWVIGGISILITHIICYRNNKAKKEKETVQIQVAPLFSSEENNINVKHSTNFWIIYALWLFTTLFMCVVELMAVSMEKEIDYMHYGFIVSDISGILLILFLSLFLYLSKPFLSKLSVAFLLLYIMTQLIIIGFCFYEEINNLGNAVMNRILFMLFHIAICYFSLRKKSND